MAILTVGNGSSSCPLCQPLNKQLQRTVMGVTRASFHYALAPRWLGQRAATELRR
jgi:hypothetical protein